MYLLCPGLDSWLALYCVGSFMIEKGSYLLPDLNFFFSWLIYNNKESIATNEIP